MTRLAILLVCLLAAWPVHAAVVSGGGSSTGGAGDVGSVSASTATNPSAEAQLKEITLTAAALNTANKKLMVHASGRYTTAAAQTPTIRFRGYLCTVSGCGSGTVITVYDFTTAATTASVTNSWQINGSIGTITAGATGTLEFKFWQQVQLGAAANLTPETRLDQTNAASSAIDLTGVLYFRTTALMSSANAGNSVVQRTGWVDGGAGTGGGSGGLASTDIDTCAEIAAIVSGETGTCGSLVLSVSPALTTPNLGTPSAATLTNATGLPISTGVSGLGTGVATFLATPSSANLASAVTGETGSGAVVFGTAPTIDAGILTTSVLLPNGTAVPGTCSIGMIYFDNDATAGVNLYGCTASNTWTLLGDGGGGGSMATDTIWDVAGDLVVGSGSNTAARLAIGSEGTALIVSGGAVAWGTPSGSGMTHPQTMARASIGF